MPAISYTAQIESLIARDYVCDAWGNCSNSGWYYWGRWVLAGIVIFIFVLCMGLVCTNSRKRVQSGRTPIYGTGWLVLPTYQQSQQAYNMPNYGAPPQYYEGGGPQQQQQQQQPMQQGYAQPPPQTPHTQAYSFYDNNGNFNNQVPVGNAAPGPSNDFYAPPANPPQAYVKN